jgi:hypothetical protein
MVKFMNIYKMKIYKLISSSAFKKTCIEIEYNMEKIFLEKYE